MYFLLCTFTRCPLTDFLASNRPVFACKVASCRWRPSKALSYCLHGTLSTCKALSHVCCNFRALSISSTGNSRAVSYWFNLVCVYVIVCRHVCVYRIRGGVSAPRGRDCMCLIKPSVRSVSCCRFFSQVLSSGRGGVSSSNSQPDAWCPSPLGYSHAAHLSREGPKPL